MAYSCAVPAMVLDSQQPDHMIRDPDTASSWTACILRPWVILIAILPLLVIDVLGTVIASDAPDTMARRLLHMLLGIFDVPPSLATIATSLIIVAVLLCWHLLQRDPWTLPLRAPFGITLEGLAWSIPLLLLSSLFSAAALAGTATAEQLLNLSVPDRMLVSIAAGLDEELVFRMAGIALLHTVFVDLLGRRQGVGTMLAIAGTAVLFAWYHDPSLDSAAQLVFALLAGCYLGVLYVLRGFGVVVWTHVLYDVAVTVVFA